METCYLVTPTAALPGVVPVVPRYRGKIWRAPRAFRKQLVTPKPVLFIFLGTLREVFFCDTPVAPHPPPK